MTRSPGPHVTVVIHRDGELESRTWRLPIWLVRAVATIAAIVVGLVIGAALLYAPIARMAARVPRLEREITVLTAENERVNELATQLARVEQRYEQVRTMLGGNIAPPRPDHGGPLSVAYAIAARAPGDTSGYEHGGSLPRHWPLGEPGVITRGQVGGSSDQAHPGIDIAIPMGTPIRAAGGGTVAAAGDDPEYGRFILITHPDGYQSMYGHASRVLVLPGQVVSAGEVIGLSGSTGRSTAPHLHFEIRHGGRSIDPRSMLVQEF
jgi:murein DD-endopeptidase MepM/ murein hydrolase activator NlpD